MDRSRWLATRDTTVEAPAGRQPVREVATKAISAAWWIARFLLALFVFVGALEVMKQGAGQIQALQNNGPLVNDPLATLGLGWLGALIVLSGSPIAASALTLVAGGSITEIQGFTMVTGSRLGAAFVVLVVAVIYALRAGPGKRIAPVSTAVIALSTTAFVYVPGALVGFGLLKWHVLEGANLQFPAQFSSLIDIVYGSALARLDGIPAFALFLGGLGLLLIAFKLMDAVVPEISEDSVIHSKYSWLHQKWGMFGVGCMVALVTMSVSVALTVLVPVVSKGHVKRETIVPYIMGANITTLGDTLLAAFLLNSASAVRIVLAGIFGTTLVSVLILAFFYPHTRRAIWGFHRQVLKGRSRLRLAVFTAGLFLVPMTMIAVSGLIR